MWEIGRAKQSARAALVNYYWYAVVISAVCLLIASFGDAFNAGFDPDGRRISILGQLFSQNYYGAIAWNGAWLHVGATILAVVIALLQIFISNPLSVGLARYITKSQLLGGSAPFKEIWWGFRCGSYGNVVKIMLLRDLYTFFWTLLFVIPGIVKSLEYTMIPYILAENPEVDTSDAFALTKDMMSGSRFQMFLLQLSFIGWFLLGGLGVGIIIYMFKVTGPLARTVATSLGGLLVSVFVIPYVEASVSEVYLTVRSEIGDFPFSGFGVTEVTEDEFN